MATETTLVNTEDNVPAEADKEDAELEASDVLEDATPTSSGVKRKRTEPKDPNAPKRPSTAYIFFNTEMRPKVKEEQPTLGLSERSKLIGKMWGSLEPAKKQHYVDMAEKDKQRYIREYMAYQDTDSYKEFMRKKYPGLVKKTKVRAESPPPQQQTTKAKGTTGKTPLSCQQQYVPGSNIPIFSDEFLQHNREMETQLRKLRQSSANLEEENALLSRHVESMKIAVEKVQKEVERQQNRNTKLQDHLVTLREVLATTFKDIPLPGTNETPTPDNVDSYMSKLQLAIANEPEKHPELVSKVSTIARQLESMLKQKLSQESAEESSAAKVEQSDSKESTTDVDTMATEDEAS